LRSAGRSCEQASEKRRNDPPHSSSRCVQPVCNGPCAGDVADLALVAFRVRSELGRTATPSLLRSLKSSLSRFFLGHPNAGSTLHGPRGLTFCNQNKICWEEPALGLRLDKASRTHLRPRSSRPGPLFVRSPAVVPEGGPCPLRSLRPRVLNPGLLLIEDPHAHHPC
jgi:hypothetical protein